MDTLVQRVHANPTAEGFEEVIMPGERERRLETKYRRSGVPFHAKEVAQMQEAAAKAGLPPLEVSNTPFTSNTA
jgi:LDH2 family malate/lactate/ureidoglycolate dehydrogenase